MDPSTFFPYQYRCESAGSAATTAKATDGSGNTVVTGECVCKSGQTCRWRHVLDPGGNVVESSESGCPCPLTGFGAMASSRSTSTRTKGIAVGKGVAIAIAVVGGLILAVGIGFLAAKYSKRSGPQ